MALGIQQVNYCCGAQILDKFSDTPEKVKLDLEAHKKSRMHSQAAQTLVFLNDGQKLRYHDVLESEGFRLVVSGAHNGKHDSKIYTYVHVFRPDKSDPVLFPAAEVDY